MLHTQPKIANPSPRVLLEIKMTLSGFTKKTLADAIGVSHATLYNWLKGRNFPNKYSRAKIEKATNGKIKGNDFLDLFDSQEIINKT